MTTKKRNVSVFLCLLAILIVGGYFLHTEPSVLPTGQLPSAEQIDNVWTGHYHATEHIAGELYVLRRFESAEGANNSERTELWRYADDGGEKKVRGNTVTDFRVAPSGEFIIVEEGSTSLANQFLLIDRNGIVLRDFTDAVSAVRSENSALRLLTWSANEVWLQESLGQHLVSLMRIEPRAGTPERFDLDSLDSTVSEYALNAPSHRIIYSTFVSPLEFEPNKPPTVQYATMSVFELKTSEGRVLLTENRSTPFSPKWIDTNTIQYIDQKGEVTELTLL